MPQVVASMNKVDMEMIAKVVSMSEAGQYSKKASEISMGGGLHGHQAPGAS